ncbi:MAG: DUF1732 domain-containing protein [Solobacterium sp.]|nr:DUF1732 domain-containing protein [Solobacterium sp.]
MTEIRFTIPIQPPAKTFQDKGIGISKSGKRYLYDRADLAEEKEKLKAWFSHFRPEQPLKAPVGMSLGFLYKETDRHHAMTWKTTKPDCDNLAKTITDILQELGFFKDDKDIAELYVAKGFDEVPSIEVKLVELEEVMAAI